MELEIRSLPEDDRQKSLNRWNSYKVELKRQIEQFNKTKSEIKERERRSELLGAGSNVTTFQIEEEVNHHQKCVDINDYFACFISFINLFF